MPTSPGPLLATLSELWDRLRVDVPDLPPVRPVISPTSRLADHSPRWSRDDDGLIAGLIVNADALQAGADVVLENVLHDAAHILNWLRGVSDTTMNGVYHNQSFLTAAEEVGLIWPEGASRVKGKGFPNPVLSDAARTRHAADIHALEEVIPLTLPHLELPSTTRAGRTDRVSMACKCDPPRKFRIGRTVAAQGPIICGVCNSPFTSE
ncbi:hypothetical protein ABZ445_16100 [Streptomyces chartreusis]|uniref:hypothetical protein n=1 Tax=Streptomyces chartreusis TaxID=1969 RepID=UPI00340D6E12